MFDVINGMTEKEMRKTESLWQIVIEDKKGVVSDIVCTTEGANPNPDNYAQCIAVINMMFKPSPKYQTVIIKKDGKDFQRWDRELIVDSNHWIEVDTITKKPIEHTNQFSFISKEIQ